MLSRPSHSSSWCLVGAGHAFHLVSVALQAAAPHH